MSRRRGTAVLDPARGGAPRRGLLDPASLLLSRKTRRQQRACAEAAWLAVVGHVLALLAVAGEGDVVELDRERALRRGDGVLVLDPACAAALAAVLVQVERALAPRDLLLLAAARGERLVRPAPLPAPPTSNGCGTDERRPWRRRCWRPSRRSRPRRRQCGGGA